MATSPFKLFRKYQKILLIVAGVTAILVFTVGDSLMMIGRDQQVIDDMVVANWSEGEIRQQEVMNWVMSRKQLGLVLNDLASATTFAGAEPLQDPLISEAAVDVRNTVYMMLLTRKADELGVTVSDARVTEYIKALTANALSKERISEVVANRRWKVSNVYEAIRNEMKAQQVLQIFFGAVDFSTNTPAADFDYYLRVNRRVAADVVAFPVDDFLSQVADPSERELREYFDRFKQDEPRFDVYGRTELPSPLPAFKQPRKAAVEYFVADFNTFVERVEVTEEEMRQHYDENRSFYIEQQLPAADDEDREPADSEPTDSEPGDSEPADSEPGDSEPTDSEPVDSEPGDSEPTDSEPADGDAPAGDDGSDPADDAAVDDAAVDDADVDEAAAPPADDENQDRASEATEGSQAPEAAPTGEPADTEANGPPATDEAPADEAPADEAPAAPDATAPPATDDPAVADADDSPAEDAGESPANDAAAPPADEDLFGEPPATDSPSEVDPEADDPTAADPAEVDPSDAPPVDGDPTADKDDTDRADDEAPGEDQPPREVTYKPFEEVQADIRVLLARRKARQEINDVMQELRSRLNDYNIQRASATPDMPESRRPVRPDFAAIARGKGLKSDSTELLSAAEFQAEEQIGNSFEIRTTQFGQEVQVPFVAALFERTGPSSLFIPMLTEDSDSNQYLSWKVEEVESKVPTLDEVREQVVRSWKLGAGVDDDSTHARGLARAAAAKMIQEASSPTASLLELGRRAGRPQVETNLFSWIEPPLDMRSQPTVSLSTVNGVEQPGPEFFSVATGLGVGELGVTMNHPKTFAYAVKVVEEEQSIDDLMQEFLDRSGSPITMMAAQMAMQFDWRDVQRQWFDDLEKQYGLQWQVEPESINE